jgi:hypothetical protein
LWRGFEREEVELMEVEVEAIRVGGCDSCSRRIVWVYGVSSGSRVCSLYVGRLVWSTRIDSLLPFSPFNRGRLTLPSGVEFQAITYITWDGKQRDVSLYILQDGEQYTVEVL